MDGINELLSQILGKTAANQLKGVSTRTLGHMQVSEITATYGISQEAAIKLQATMALAIVMNHVPLERGAKFLSSRAIFRHFGPLLRDCLQEELHAIYMDGQHRVIEHRMIHRGTSSDCPVHPRDVFRPAVRMAARAVVLVHNHPSGDSEPSSDDIEITHRLRSAGAVLGITVLDHIIIGQGVYTSLADRGLMSVVS